MNRLAWRIGSKVPINVYEGDRPVCQCHTAADARFIVAAVNAAFDQQLRRLKDAIREAGLHLGETTDGGYKVYKDRVKPLSQKPK